MHAQGEAVRAHLGQEIDQPLKEILAIDIAVIVHEHIDHEMWMVADMAESFQDQLASLTSCRRDSRSGRGRCVLRLFVYGTERRGGKIWCTRAR